MSNMKKDQIEILEKLGIEKLNAMQEEALQVIASSASTVLLSPTGTGKTLAFLLPVLKMLDPERSEVQVLILVPSRELAIQIEQVTREMGSGYKTNAVYGGRAFSKDKTELSHPPAILIGTPGRVADHIRRETFSIDAIKILVLDEFDKSLETGFEAEMSEIISSLPNLEKRILTSATEADLIPRFAGVKNPMYINFLTNIVSQLQVKVVTSPAKNKLDTLIALLGKIKNESGIIFCNYKDSIQDVSDYLQKNNISHGSFHGGMEQKDRERALIKFRNGTQRLIIATDLAARGIDVPEIGFIIHYELPQKSEEFTHRNGRTARMHQSGTAFVLHWEKELLPDFIENNNKDQKIHAATGPAIASWQTLFISGGRKDKISKGDIAGLFLKQGNLEKEELGNIELKQDCAFVAVPAAKAKKLIQDLNNSRLKRKKVRISLI